MDLAAVAAGTTERAGSPVAALKDRLRANEGCFPSLSAVAIAALTMQYREHPGWTAQLHLDNLRVACKASDSSVASYATVRRYLRAQWLATIRLSGVLPHEVMLPERWLSLMPVGDNYPGRFCTGAGPVREAGLT
jgi:hypothetical protein